MCRRPFQQNILCVYPCNYLLIIHQFDIQMLNVQRLSDQSSNDLRTCSISLWTLFLMNVRQTINVSIIIRTTKYCFHILTVCTYVFVYMKISNSISDAKYCNSKRQNWRKRKQVNKNAFSIHILIKFLMMKKKQMRNNVFIIYTLFEMENSCFCQYQLHLRYVNDTQL